MDNDNIFKVSDDDLFVLRRLCKAAQPALLPKWVHPDFVKDTLYGQSTITTRPWQMFNINDEDRCLLRNEFLQPTKKEQQMFEKFNSTSRKLIEVPATIYELITDHALRAIHLPQGVAKDLLNESDFIIGCEDATLFVNLTSTVNSKVSNSDVIVTFELD